MTPPEGFAEAPAPYRFTWDQVLRMAEEGIIDEDAHVELIEGELVQMSPQSVHHRRVTKWLLKVLYSDAQRLGWDLESQAPAVLDMGNAPEPDIYVYRSGLNENEIKGSDIVLVIEVSGSSLKLDLGRKAAVYARAGIREYWVADIIRREMVVHRDPVDGAFASVQRMTEPQSLSALAIPGVVISLSDFPRG